MNYIQHNPGLSNGRDALVEGFREKFLREPDFFLQIEKIIAEDNMVAVYIKNVGKDGKTKCRVVDIYRIENGMLTEHWDVLQPCDN